MSKKIFIYSIPRKSAFGIHEWTSDVSGKKLKKNKIAQATDTVQALYSAKFGGLANGLSYKKWIEDGKQKMGPDGTPLTLQDKMERKWNLDKGYLSNRPWMKGDSLREADMTYYQKKSWVLNDGATLLDLDSMDDELFYYVCLDSKFVANSEKEWRANKWPKAQYYIALENEEAEIKYKKNAIKSEAFATLHSDDMTPTMMEKFCGILKLTSTLTSLTIEQSHNLLYSYIDSSTFTPGNNIDKYMELYHLLNDAPGRVQIEARYLIQRALDSRVIFEYQGAYKWVRPKGELELGNTYQEAIDFVINKKKAALVEELEETIKVKSNG